MKQQKDDSVKLETPALTDDAGAPITGGVTIDILRPDNTVAVAGQAATHMGNGIHRYVLAKTDFTVYGTWTAIWKWSVGGTNRQHRVLLEGVFA